MFHQLKQGSLLKLRDEILEQKEQNSKYYFSDFLYSVNVLFCNTATDNLLQSLDVEMWKEYLFHNMLSQP